MHEASLISGLVAQVEQIARDSDAAKIVGIDIWLGALSHISPDHLEDHFVKAASGTIAEGAALAIEQSVDVHHAHAQEVVLKGVDVLDREHK